MFAEEPHFSFKSLFVPLTTAKAISFIILIGIIVFGNMLFNNFVADDITILSNPIIQSIGNLPILLLQKMVNSTGSGLLTGSYYVPFSLITLSFIYSTFGNIPFFFHLFQLILHIASASMVFIIFTRIFSKKISLFLSLIFLIHPINQETVAYIADYQDILYLFWGLLALTIFLKIKNGKLTLLKLSAISLLLLFSILSKITGILFLALIFVYVGINYKKNFFQYFFAFTAILIFYFILKFSATNVLFAIEPSSIGRVDEFIRFITIPKIFFYYIFTFFYPKTLIAQQDWIVQSINFTDFYLPLLMDALFIAGVTTLGILTYKKSKKIFPVFVFFCLWFAMGIILHIQILPLDFTVSDRWFYFPIIGFLGLVGVAIQILKITPKVLIAVSLIIIIILSMRTIDRNKNWKDGFTLYSHDLAFAKDNVYLNGLLGNEYMNMGKYDDALVYFYKVAKLTPLQERNWINIGASYYLKGDLKLSEKYFRKAAEVGKSQTKYDRLGQLYIQEKRFKEAKSVYELAAKEFPKYQRVQLYLAYCEYNLHNKQKALEIATKAYQENPTSESQYVLTQITNDQEIKLQ